MTTHKKDETKIKTIKRIYHTDEQMRISRLEDAFVRMDKTLEEIKNEIKSLRLELKEDIKSLDSRIWHLFFWTIGGFVASGASFVTLLGVMAKGFHWL